MKGKKSNQKAAPNNNKYRIGQYDYHPQDVEGEINNFQIYDNGLKQVPEKHIMPSSPNKRLVDRNSLT